MIYKRCTTPNAAFRQKQVEECLLSSMADTPYQEITVTQLCQQMNMSRKAFYRYYSSKDACLCSLLDRMLMECRLFEIPSKNFHSDTSREIASFLAFWKQKKNLLDVLIKNNLIDRLISRSIYFLVNEEQPAFHKNKIHDFFYDESVQLFSLTGIFAVIVQWHITGYSLSNEEMARKMTRLLFQPMMHEQTS